MKKHIYKFLFGEAATIIQHEAPKIIQHTIPKFKIRQQYLEDNDEELLAIKNKMKPFVRTIAKDSVSDHYGYHKFRLDTAERRKKEIEKTKAKQDLSLESLSSDTSLETDGQQNLIGEDATKDT